MNVEIIRISIECTRNEERFMIPLLSRWFVKDWLSVPYLTTSPSHLIKVMVKYTIYQAFLESNNK